jgi:hypothetical protein
MVKIIVRGAMRAARHGLRKTIDQRTFGRAKQFVCPVAAARILRNDSLVQFNEKTVRQTGLVFQFTPRV